MISAELVIRLTVWILGNSTRAFLTIFLATLLIGLGASIGLYHFWSINPITALLIELAFLFLNASQVIIFCKYKTHWDALIVSVKPSPLAN